MNSPQGATSADSGSIQSSLDPFSYEDRVITSQDSLFFFEILKRNFGKRKFRCIDPFWGIHLNYWGVIMGYRGGLFELMMMNR